MPLNKNAQRKVQQACESKRVLWPKQPMDFRFFFLNLEHTNQISCSNVRFHQIEQQSNACTSAKPSNYVINKTVQFPKYFEAAQWCAERWISWIYLWIYKEKWAKTAAVTILIKNQVRKRYVRYCFYQLITDLHYINRRKSNTVGMWTPCSNI